MVSTEELKALLSLAGMTQADLAVIAECSQPRISKVINNPSKCSLKANQIKALLSERCSLVGHVTVHPQSA